jgi:hypothetical protein
MRRSHRSRQPTRRRQAVDEVYLENNQLFYRPVVQDGEEAAAATEGILLFS